MQQYTIPRDGLRPVRFTGELLAYADGRVHNGKSQPRAYWLALYQAENRRYVVHIAYVTQWQGEASHNQVETCATMDEAITYLEAFNPIAWVEGFKHLFGRGETLDNNYQRRQQALEQQIWSQYQSLMSELCHRLDIAESL